MFGTRRLSSVLFSTVSAGDIEANGSGTIIDLMNSNAAPGAVVVEDSSGSVNCLGVSRGPGTFHTSTCP